MVRKVMSLFLATTLLMLWVPSAFAATNNSVDRVPHVKDSHEFDENFFVRLRIEEAYPNHFGTENQHFRIHLHNAEWYDDSHPLNASRIGTQTMTRGGASVVAVRRVTSTIMDVTLRSDGSTDEKALWVIPLFTKVTGAGYATVTIDGRDSMVSSGTYSFAYGVGRSDDLKIQLDVTMPVGEHRQMPVGYEFGTENPVKLLIQENRAGAFGPTARSFQLRLEKALWFADSFANLNVSAMDQNSHVLSGKNAAIQQISKRNDQVIEITVHPGVFSGDKMMLEVPLYFKIAEPGEVSLNMSLVGSSIREQRYVVGQALLEDRDRDGVGKKDEDYVKDSSDKDTYKDKDNHIDQDKEPHYKVVQFFIDKKYYVLDGTIIETDVAPYIKVFDDGLGRTMVPLSFASTALGSDSVEWIAEERKVIIRKGADRVALTIDSSALDMNGEVILMDVPAEIVDIGDGLGRTMIPIAYVAQAFQVEYVWDDVLRAVTFMKPVE
ncbi:copper amine oxidase N-terminal domain-containing protein [Heliorestis convoluta]|uniref:Copper amine oxidase N-terminal domain-containing protein n=1 Tax=Heliorestis convoluta TaxID=356322 RepID=A0A5Q2MX39_9FIRM|nr:copper amine oxidase N-terminal domain-containing protein [Heliorestis convoluta]QGG47204.1 copper amine oxidase N-terminal domain-containing protein [Heliorestis convoluta]